MNITWGSGGNWSNSSALMEPEPLASAEAFVLFRIVYIGFTITIGFVVNSCYLLSSIANLRSLSSAAQYLMAIAAADFCALFILLLTWLHNAFQLELYNDFTCKLFTFIGSLGCSLSPILITGLTVERLIAVLFPLHGQRLLTRELTRVLIVCIFVCGSVYNSWSFFAVKAYHIGYSAGCTVTPEYYDVALKLDTINTMLVFSIPIAVIFISNTLIVAKLAKRQKRATNTDVRKAAQMVVELSDVSRSPSLPGGVIRLSRLHRTKHLSDQCGGSTFTLTPGTRSRLSSCNGNAGNESRRPSRELRSSLPRAMYDRVARQLLMASSIQLLLNITTYAFRLTYFFNTNVEFSEAVRTVQKISYLAYSTQFCVHCCMYSNTLSKTVNLVYCICCAHKAPDARNGLSYERNSKLDFNSQLSDQVVIKTRAPHSSLRSHQPQSNW